jgi:hypothetical protein
LYTFLDLKELLLVFGLDFNSKKNRENRMLSFSTGQRNVFFNHALIWQKLMLMFKKIRVFALNF